MKPDKITTDERVFGVGHRLHPVTGMPLNQGVGAAGEREQAEDHLNVIRKNEGYGAWQRMRHRVWEHYGVERGAVMADAACIEFFVSKMLADEIRQAADAFFGPKLELAKTPAVKT